MTCEMMLPVHMSEVVRDQNCEVSGNMSEPQCLGGGGGWACEARGLPVPLQSPREQQGETIKGSGLIL